MTTLAILPGIFITGGLAAAGTAAVSIPIAIHLLTRMRRQQQPWAAMRFLVEAYRRQRQRLRIEQLLLLIVRCLIMVLLGLALAGPYFHSLHNLGDGSGRLVCFVIDDALSTQAATPGQKQRFDQLRETAQKITEALAPGDRVALWTTARPITARLAPPAADLPALRRALAALTPRYSRSDWPGALAAVSATLADQNFDHDRVTIVLLSDFSSGSLDLSQPASSELVALGKRGRMIVSQPAPALANVQIAGVTPMRSMVLVPADETAVISVEVKLRRFVSEVGGSVSGVRVEVLGEDPTKALAAVNQDYHWTTGQTSAVLHMDLPVPPTATAGQESGTGQTLALHATLQSGGDDALAADNQRWALVEVRHRLEVGLIDDLTTSGNTPGAAAGETTVNLRPRDWLHFVLSPDSGKGPIDLVDLAPAVVDEQALSHLDAVMILRPDQLGPTGWPALKAFAKRGGLIWVFAPAIEAPALWATAFREQMGLDWQIGLNAHAAGDKPDADWSLTVDSPAPEPLRLLSADWAPLLRPVSVKRRLDLSTRGGQESLWLKLGGLGPETPAGLMASASVGDGHILFLATALDPAWTNLMTKPLFLPLLHESLRGVLGSSAEAARVNGITSGDEPNLSSHWDSAQELIRWGEHTRVSMRRTDRGLETAVPLDEPGIYVAHPGAALRLVVNPDADAGNTTPLDAVALGQWLSTIGTWSWIDADAPAKFIMAEPPRTNLGWPLLWASLALILFETYLARAFSHALVPPGTPGASGPSSDPGRQEAAAT